MVSDNLSGKVIVVTRAVHQAEQFIHALKNEGARVVHVPAIKIAPPDSWAACDRALAQLDTYDWIVFTSVNAVSFFEKRVAATKTRLGGCPFKIAAVGERTANHLLDNGFRISMIPDSFNAKALARSFEKIRIKNRKILLPTAQKQGEFLAEELARQGALVDVIPVYKNECGDENISNELTMLHQMTPDVITFTSPSTFQNFMFRVGKTNLRKWIDEGSKIAVIGEVTETAVTEAGFVAEIIPRDSTIPSLIETISDHYHVR